MIIITIITKLMSKHCSINMYKSKWFYQYKSENLTHHFYDNDCFNNEECGFKVKIVVGIWVDWKYGICLIVRKLYSDESNNYTHQTLQDYGGMNQLHNETYDLQYTNSNILIKITITTKHITLNFSINLFTWKLLYPNKRNNLTYHFYEDYCFKKE